MKQFLSEEFREIVWESKVPIMVSLSYDEKTESSVANLFVSILLK